MILTIGHRSLITYALYLLKPVINYSLADLLDNLVPMPPPVEESANKVKGTFERLTSA